MKGVPLQQYSQTTHDRYLVHFSTRALDEVFPTGVGLVTPMGASTEQPNNREWLSLARIFQEAWLVLHMILFYYCWCSKCFFSLFYSENLTTELLYCSQSCFTTSNMKIV